MSIDNERNDDDRTPMAEDLCKSCGLCCKDIFHDYVDLEDPEFQLVHVYGLTQYSERQAFALPCPLHDGCCTIYDQRPNVCRDFECDVLKAYIAGDLTRNDAQQLIDNVFKLVGEIDSAVSRGEHAGERGFWQRVNTFLRSQADSLSKRENFERNGITIAKAERLKVALNSIDARYFAKSEEDERK